MDRHFAKFSLDANCRVEVREIRHADLANRVPVLAKCLCLSWSKKRKIRLIIRVDARHQLNVRSIGVGEALVPCIAEFVISPSPLFFSWSDMVIGNMNHA